MIARRAVAFALILAAGCSRCGARSAGSAEELLPAAAAGAVTTAPLGTLAQHGALLVEKAAQLPGGEQLGDYRKALAARLGFDPLTRDGLLSAGLDPDRGAALGFFTDGAEPRLAWLIALPLTKPELFAQTFDQVARERAGFAQRTDEARGETRIALFDNGRGKVAQAIVRGYGLVARGADPAGAIAAAAALNPEGSLAKHAGLTAAKGKTGLPDLLAFAPAGSALPKRWVQKPLPGDVSVGVTGTPQGLAARLFLQLPQGDAQAVSALLPGGGAALAELLPASAPLRARLGFAAARLPLPLAFTPAGPLVQRLRAELKAQGVDLDVDLFGSLEPGLVFSLGVSPRINVAQAVDLGFLDWRTHSPFDTLQLVALAGVHDKPRLLAALDAVAKVLPQFGAKALRSSVADTDYSVTYAAGEGARFGVRSIGGRDVAYVTGALAPDELKSAGKSGPPELFTDAGATVQLDLGKLAQTVTALPEAAYGSGPQSYVAHSLVNQVALPLSPLRLSLSAAPGTGGITADLALAIETNTGGAAAGAAGAAPAGPATK